MNEEIIEQFENALRNWALVIALAERNLDHLEDRLRRQLASSTLTPMVRSEASKVQDRIVSNREKVNESKMAISIARDRLDELREVELPVDFDEHDIQACFVYMKTGRTT